MLFFGSNDEISGLSGIEGLIKDVSLDHHRFGRDIKETEKTMEAVRLQLHPETVLNAEEKVLETAEKDLKDHDTMLTLADEGDGLVSSASSVRQGILLLDRGLAAIPDTEAAIKEVTRAEVAGNKASSASKLNQAGGTVTESIKDLNRKLAGIPDTATAAGELSRADDFRKIAESATTMSATGIATAVCIEGLQKKLDQMPDGEKAASFANIADISGRKTVLMTGVLGQWTETNRKFNEKKDRETAIDGKLQSIDHLKRASEMVEMLTGAEAILKTANGLILGEADLRKKVELTIEAICQAEEQRDALLATVKTCPLTLKPVSKECLEGVLI